ncbi:hypothetical protein Tco_1162929 [Tanacetum coccineum]
MMLLERAITQRYSTPTNNRLRTSLNTRNQAVIQDGRVDIQIKNVGYARNGNMNVGRQTRNQATNAVNVLVQSIEKYDQNVQRIPRIESTPGKTNVQCYNCNGKGHYVRDYQNPRVRDAKYFKEQMLLATKDEAKVHLDEEKNDCMLDNAYGDNALEEINATLIMMAHIQPTDDNSDAKPTYDAEFISEVNASQIDIINGLLLKSDLEQRHHEKLETIIYTSPDGQIDSDIIYDDPYVYDTHLKTGLGYENPKRLKKSIEAQPKMYDGEKLESNKLKVDLPDYEETLEDVEKIRLKMKDKMIKLDYQKLNALYKSFVPQTEIPIEQTYFSSLSTSNVSSESSLEKSDLPPKKMPNESKFLKLFVNLDKEIKELGKLIIINLKIDKDNTFHYDNIVGIR